MALLDNLNPIVQAKLMMAAGLLSPVRNKGWRGFAEAAGSGIQGGLLGYNQGSALQARLKEEEQQRQMRDMQMGQMKQALEAQNRQREVLGGMPDFSRPSLPDMAPTNENAAALAQAPKPLPHEVMLKRAEYLSQKGLPDLADKYYQNADRLRPEVKEVGASDSSTRGAPPERTISTTPSATPSTKRAAAWASSRDARRSRSR